MGIHETQGIASLQLETVVFGNFVIKNNYNLYNFAKNKKFCQQKHGF